MMQEKIHEESSTYVPQEIISAPEWAQDIYHRLPCLATYDDISNCTQMNRGTIANFHSEGKGPLGSILLGKKRVFPRLEVVKWMLSRLSERRVEG